MAVLTDDQIQQRLAAVPGWRYEGGELKAEFKRNGFVGAMAFTNAVALIAQAQDHHPDFAISWDTVTLTCRTHSEGGITDKDFKLAAAINQQVAARQAEQDA
jgi:4a-hydroxytetrahydrobiopterin dehydratase